MKKFHFTNKAAASLDLQKLRRNSNQEYFRISTIHLNYFNCHSPLGTEIFWRNSMAIKVVNNQCKFARGYVPYVWKCEPDIRRALLLNPELLLGSKWIADCKQCQFLINHRDCLLPCHKQRCTCSTVWWWIRIILANDFQPQKTGLYLSFFHPAMPASMPLWLTLVCTSIPWHERSVQLNNLYQTIEAADASPSLLRAADHFCTSIHMANVSGNISESKSQQPD